MPRTTAKLNVTSAEVLTLSEAAVYLRLPQEDVLRLVEAQGLPARKMGTEWRFLKDAIKDWLRATPSSLSTQEAVRSLAGAWRDDPYLEDMLEEIYRARGRPITEDGSYRLFHGLDRAGDGR